MITSFIAKLIFNLAGWKGDSDLPKYKKCILLVVPHTSNWDFIYGRLYYTSIKGRASVLIKKNLFFWPLGPILKIVGGIPVNRSKNENMLDKLVAEFKKREILHLAIAPEGTRNRVKRWKKGFYNIAMKANVPISIIYIDYKKKYIGFKGVFFPTGNIDEDMKKLRSFYKDVTPRYPENFYIE